MTNRINKKMFKIIGLVFLSLTFCFLFFSTFEVLAQDYNYVPPGMTEKDIGGADNIDVTCAKYDYPWCKEGTSGGISGLVNNFYGIALGLAGASALGVLIYGAILWTLSGAVTSKQDALEWIWGAIWGLVLLLGAYLILNTINPDLVSLQEPKLKQATLPIQAQNSEVFDFNKDNPIKPLKPKQPGESF